MQIIIDIPEEMYKKIKETNMIISGRRSGRTFDYVLFNAVNTGTPLPKDANSFYIKGQKDMTDAIRKAIDEKKESLPKNVMGVNKDDVKIGLMIAHNIVNNVYKELVKANKENKVDCKRTNCDNCINHKYCDYE